MTIQQLKYAIILDQEKSFAKASLKLNIAQPTLSLQIQKLEQELKIKIFDRTKNPIETTSLGLEFIRQAKNVQNEMDKLEFLFSDSSKKIKGEFKFGIIPTVASSILVKILPSLTKKYPDLILKIYEISTKEIIELLQKNELDMGLLATPLGLSKFKETPIYYEPFTIYLSPKLNSSKKEINLDDYLENEIFILGEEHCFRNQSLKLCKNKAVSRIESGSFDTIKKLVDSNLGIAILPKFEEVNDISRKKILKGYHHAREISLITNQNFYKNHILKAIQAEIISIIPKEFLDKKKFKIIGIDEIF